MKATALFMCLFTPFSWFIVLLLLGFLLPPVADFLAESVPFAIGSNLALFILVSRALLTERGRMEARIEYWKLIGLRYYKLEPHEMARLSELSDVEVVEYFLAT